MTEKSLPLPDRSQYQYGYQVAYKLASEQLSAVRDLEGLCHRSDSRLETIDGQHFIVVRYLAKDYRISHPDIEVSAVDGQAEVSLKDKLLILHYLNCAQGTPVSGRAVTYKELPECINYASNFAKRAVRPLMNNFGHQPDRLPEVTAALDARRVDCGDVAVVIDAFPRVPITLVLWRGDDEFDAEGNILFDSSIQDYLSTEDITVVCESIAWRLVSILKASG